MERLGNDQPIVRGRSIGEKVASLITGKGNRQVHDADDEPVSTDRAESRRKPGYYLEPNDWPTDIPRDDLTVEELYDVLDSFDDAYEVAMNGLRNVGKKASDT